MRPNAGQESHPSAAPPSPPSPFCPLLQWLTKSSYSASKPAGWPAEPAGYELCSSLIHLPPLARRSQLPPQASAWFNNSPLQASSTRSGARASSLPSTPPPRIAPPVSATASPISVAETPMPAAAPCKQRQKPGARRATSRWPAPPRPPPSSRRSRTREAAATWVP